MEAIRSLQTLGRRIADRLAVFRKTTELECGECERWERCGLPPSEDCISKAEQLTRDGGRKRNAWWQASLGV